ncbi:anion permease [Desulfovibrio sp. OttesenSCG-928-C06]|nr:anion permease [Desulfovibrio sp. OttesenSCG-928-C06]
MSRAMTKQVIYFLLGPLTCLIVSNLNPPTGMTEAGMLNLGACCWLMIWWMTEIFPMPATALMAIPIFAFLGVMAPGKAFSFLGTPGIMLIFGATILVGLMKESNFITRYAYWILTRRMVRGSARRMLLMFTLSIGLLSAIAPNVPLAILFVSITVALGRNCNMPANSSMMRGMCVLSGAAPAIGGIGTPLGGAPNMVIIALIAKVLDHEVSFWQWSAIGLPLSFISLTILTVIAWGYFLRNHDSSQTLSTESLDEKLEALGPVTRHEHIAMICIVTALILWSFGPQLAGLVGWGGGVRLLKGPFVAMFLGAATFLIPFRKNKETGALEFSMTWNQAVRNVSWDILVITFGIMAFGEVLLAGGVDKWMAGLIQAMLGDISGILVWFMLILLSGICSQIITNIALMSLVIPLAASLAVVYNLSPLAVCLTVGMASNVAIMFPFSSVTAAAAIMGGQEYSRPRDFAGFGFIVTLVISCTVFVLGYFMSGLIL